MFELITALPTAFDEEGLIQTKGIKEMVRFNIDNNKVDGLYVGGSTGEAFLLSFEDKKELFKAVAEENQGAVKLMAQIGSLNINESMELARYVEALGYDVVSAVPPFYYKFSKEEVLNYYEKLTAASNLPMVIYSIPVLSGVEFDMNDFDRLFANEKIIGVKYTAQDFYLLERLRSQYPNKKIYSGFDEALLPALSLGVDGAIGSTFNVNAPLVREIVAAFAAGEMKQAFAKQAAVNNIISALLNNGLYQTIKYIFELNGVSAGYTKLPMAHITEEQKEGAQEIKQKYLDDIYA